MAVFIADTLVSIFEELNSRIEAENRRRQQGGVPTFLRCHIQVLGQMSLLGNRRVNTILALNQTGDIDARLQTESFVKQILKEEILPKYGLVYDEDSGLIWLPPGHFFEPLCDLKYVLAELLDAESALVSKAVKAKAKNKLLIRQAIASGGFPTLLDRIIANGADIQFFLEDENE